MVKVQKITFCFWLCFLLNASPVCAAFFPNKCFKKVFAVFAICSLIMQRNGAFANQENSSDGLDLPSCVGLGHDEFHAHIDKAYETRGCSPICRLQNGEYYIGEASDNPYILTVCDEDACALSQFHNGYPEKPIMIHDIDMKGLIAPDPIVNLEKMKKIVLSEKGTQKLLACQNNKKHKKTHHYRRK